MSGGRSGNGRAGSGDRDPRGTSDFQDGDVYGRTVNIASRLSSVAEAGQVVVSEDVAQRSEGVRFQDMGPVTLKGVAAPMQLFRAVR